MNDYTGFGLAVKTRLLGPPARTQVWLVKELREKTGLYIDSSYLSKLLTGQRNSPKLKAAIADILNITL